MSKTVWTKFSPGCHGWHFANSFKSFIPKIKQLGFCGGMVFSALDYAYERKPIPIITKTPDDGPLYNYILQRQLNSLCGNLPIPTCPILYKIFEWQIRPDYNELLAIYLHSLAFLTLSEWKNIKKSLDAGIPTPLMLIRTSGVEPPVYNHQVLGIGYSIEPTENKRVHLYVYNPNMPCTTQVLKFNSKYAKMDPPFVKGGKLMASDSTGHPLRGFFLVPYDRTHEEIICDFMSRVVGPLLLM